MSETPARGFSDRSYAYQKALPLVPANTEKPGDICGRAPCVQHGEHFGLLLGGALGLPAVVAALGAC